MIDMFNIDNNSDSKQSDSDVNEFNSLDACIDYTVQQDMFPIRQMLQGQPKKRKTEDIKPIVFIRLNTRYAGKPKPITVKALLDTGGSGCLLTSKFATKLRASPVKEVTTWKTPAGIVSTKSKCTAQFTIPELHETRLIEWDFHLTQDLGRYDMIIGQDLMNELGIDILYSKRTVEWDGMTIPLKEIDAKVETAYYIRDSFQLDESEAIKKILDAKYEAADLKDVVKDQDHLKEEEQQKLLTLLQKYEILFDGTLGKWKDAQYNIELKNPQAPPHHARPYPIPRAYINTLKMEVDRLCKVGVLKKVNRSEWASPTFIIPKKDKSVRFISDFRELNKRIRRKPYPIPKIQEMLMNLEGFQYATSLDLNMGYYHIELTPFAKQLCTIVLPFGKYEYQRLPMGLCNSPDVFQEKMSELMDGLDFVRTYIDDILCHTKDSFDDHLEKLELVLKKLHEAGLKVNAKKSFFARSEVEYLGYWVTRDGIQPLAKKVDAIQAIAEPKNKRDLRKFIGLVNYYRDMWIRRSHVLAPLSRLTSEGVKWQWTNVERKAFNDMKKIISRETLLSYPDFNKPFVIHTDASHTQLGAVISQDNKPIAFYSRKLNPAQTRYTTTERELLSIVETLKEFRCILLGQQIQIHTDHKNLTYKNFNTERVMRWRLILEEYSPELLYIKGSHNIVADALSRLDLEPDFKSQQTLNYFSEAFGLEDKDLPKESFPLSYKYLSKCQNADKDLLQKAKSNPKYKLCVFHGGGKRRELICKDGKIVVPSAVQQHLTEWYHTMLCHPGETRTEQTIRQHYYWKDLRGTVHDICSKCDRCQRTKKKTIKYGHLPEKAAQAEPWDVLCVDLIGPYKIDVPGKSQPLVLHCLTMIDPATSWFEIVAIPNKTAFEVANLAEITWFTRYPWPTQIIIDRGTEFMGEFMRMVKDDYGIKRKPITTRNPQANAVLERIHQTIGNMIRSMQPQNLDLEGNDPWSGILSAVAFAIRATYHTTLQATPSQLVFGRDAILNIKHDANWKFIKNRKQLLIKQNNLRENAMRKPYTYKVGDKVLIKAPENRKFGQDPYIGPYSVMQVNDNGTVILRKGAVSDTFNIRNLIPYKD